MSNAKKKKTGNSHRHKTDFVRGVPGSMEGCFKQYSE